MDPIKTNIDPSLLLKYPQCKVHPELVTEIHKTTSGKKKNSGFSRSQHTKLKKMIKWKIHSAVLNLFPIAYHLR